MHKTDHDQLDLFRPRFIQQPLWSRTHGEGTGEEIGSLPGGREGQKKGASQGASDRLVNGDQ